MSLRRFPLTLPRLIDQAQVIRPLHPLCGHRRPAATAPGDRPQLAHRRKVRPFNYDLEWKDDAPVFRRLVVVSQQVGDRPDEVRQLRMPLHLFLPGRNARSIRTSMSVRYCVMKILTKTVEFLAHSRHRPRGPAIDSRDVSRFSSGP